MDNPTKGGKGRRVSKRIGVAEGVEVKVFGDFGIGGVPLRLSATFGAEHTVFEAKLGDLSLGDIVRQVVRLAIPSLDFKLHPPWDVLNSINLRDLTFKLDTTEGRVGFTYEHLDIDLTFLRLDVLELWYTAYPKAGKTRTVDVKLYGRFLDRVYDFPNHPLSWDLLTQPPPTVPSGKPKVFDLEYLGLGQHVTLRDPDALTTMKGIIDGLMGSYEEVPDDANPLDSLPALKFDASSGWLIGTRFSVLDTVKLSAIFNDPVMYGIRVELSGERAKAFDGLEFEILYRKVTDQIGVYHTELALPDSMRQLEFGAASITLPVVVLDIYTNGNFLVDLGFPYNLDFSRSFTIQAFIGPVPVIGAGGIYFGALTGETAPDLPRIINGRFAPVIEFGLGLQLGVGKTFNKGILKAGIVIAVEGLLEGTLAFFEPKDPTLPKTSYYRIRGTIALVGHIYGEVNFAIIKARVDVYAYASVSATMEAFEVTVLVLEAGVSIALSIKVVFFSIRLSFSATVRESIAIGRPSTPPWILDSGQPVPHRLERPVAFRRFATRLRMDETFAAIHREGLTWTGMRLVGEVRTLDLYVQPMVTVGLRRDRPESKVPTDDDGAAVQLVALLFVAHGDPDSADGAASFDDLARAGLLWALETVKGAALRATPAQLMTSDVTRSQLELISQHLDTGTPLEFCSIVDFLRENFHLRIRPLPSDQATRDQMQRRGLTLFPMPPYLSLATSDSTHRVDFQTHNPCSSAYRKIVEEYYRELDAREGEAEELEQLRAAAEKERAPSSMAALIFADYFGIILRQIVQSALDAFEGFEYTAEAGQTLMEIALRFGIEGEDAIERIATANQDNEAFFVHPADGARNQLYFENLRVQALDGESLAEFSTRVQLEPLEVAENAHALLGLLRVGARLSIVGGSYRILSKDTLDGIAERFFTTVPDLLAANPDIDWSVPEASAEALPVDRQIDLPPIEYVVQTDDTLDRIAGFFGLELDALVEILKASTDVLVPLCRIPLPKIAYTIAEDDTPATVARRFGLTAREVVAANPGPETSFGTIRLPECEALPLEQLLELLKARDAFGGAGGAVARFLLNGMRLPDPARYVDHDMLDALRAGHEDWADIDLYPLYVLTGQQWEAPREPSPEYTITLSRNPLDRAQSSDCQRPLITFESDDPDHYLEVPLAPEDVKLVADYQGLLQQDPPFDPAIVYNERYPPYWVMPKHFAVGEPVAWEAAEVPDYGQDGQVSTMPTLYPLSPGLRDHLRRLTQRTHDVRLMFESSRVPGDRPSGATEILSRAWATRLDFALRRARDPAEPSAFVPDVYEVFSTDVEGRSTLRELIEHLYSHEDLRARIDLLYTANPTEGRTAALRSDALRPSEVIVVKANLSTTTHPVTSQRVRLMRAVEPELLAHASLDDPRAFLTLLWEASVVNTGGYYLFYRIADEQGGGLPPQLFNQSSEAYLSVLVTVFAGEGKQGIAAEPFHNCAVSVENLGDADAVVFVAPPVHEIQPGQKLADIATALGLGSDGMELLARANATVPHVIRPGAVVQLPQSGPYTVQLGDDPLSLALREPEPALAQVAAAIDVAADALLPGAKIYVHPDWVSRRATLPPGKIGFRMLRTDPDPDATASKESTAQDTPATRLQVLFNLLGYRLKEAGGFDESAEALPCAPAESHRQELNPSPEGVSAPWRYARVLTIAGLAKSARSSADSERMDPYAGLGGDAELGFRLYDVFGNRCLRDGTIPALKSPVRYSDPLIALSQWPGTAATYEFFKEEAGPRLRIRLAFDVQRYVSTLGELFEGPKARATEDNKLCERIDAQISQADLRFTASSTLEQAGQPLDGSLFQDFVADVRAYLGTLSELTQQCHQVAQEETLHDIASRYQLPIEALGKGNANNPNLLRPGAARALIPRLHVVVQNDSLASIAAGSSITVQALARANAAVPLKAGTIIRLARSRIEIGRDQTLQQLADMHSVRVEAVGRQNADVANLFPEGTQLLVESLRVEVEPDDTLGTIAARHHLSVVALCVANARDPELLAIGESVGIPNHLAIGKNRTATARVGKRDTLRSLANRKRVSVASLLSANLEVDGLLAAGTVMQLGSSGRLEVREGDTLATLLHRFREQSPGSHLSAAQMARQIESVTGLLKAGARLLVPPAERQTIIPLAPRYPDVIFPLKAWVSMARSEALIDPAMRDEDSVREVRTELGPQLSASDTEEGTALKLADFARRFQAAFGDLKLATGADRNGGAVSERGLMAVQFQNQTLAYRIERTPYFFAPRPLQNELWSSLPQAPVPIQEYRDGALLDPPTQRSFEGVDLDTWARDFLEDMDRMLSPALAVAARRLDVDVPAAEGGSSLDRIVRAKETLARAIRDRVAEVVASPSAGDSGPDLAAAQEALYQRLLIELSNAYRIDTIVQFRVKVVSPYTDIDTAPRFLGQVTGATYSIEPGATLEQLARHFKAPLSLLASTLADAPEILSVGAEVRLDGRATYRIKQGDTLRSVARALRANVVALANDRRQVKGLLRAGARLNLVTQDYKTAADDTFGTILDLLDGAGAVEDAVQVLVEMNGESKDLLKPGFNVVLDSYVVNDGDTLESIAEALGTTAAELGRVNRKTDDVLAPGVEVRNHRIQEGDTLASLAQAVGLPLGKLVALLANRRDLLRRGQSLRRVSIEKHQVKRGESLKALAKAMKVTPVELVWSQLEVAGLINDQAEVRYLSYVPAVSLSEAKVKLSEGSALTFLFRSASNRRLGRVPLDLSYQITEIEHNIGSVDWAKGYQTSEWLTFIDPITDYSMQRTAVPVALRAYPAPPVMIDQGIRQSRAPRPTLEDIKTYDYAYRYAYKRAAQDQLYTDLEYNVPDVAALKMAGEPTDVLPYWLARYDAIRTPLWSDLAKLSDETTKSESVLRGALGIFADFAENIARTWSGWGARETVLRAAAVAAPPRFRIRLRDAEQGRPVVSVQLERKRGMPPHPVPKVRLTAGAVGTSGRGASSAYRLAAHKSADADVGEADSVFTHEVPGLDVIEVQNIRGTVSVERNADLLPDRATNPDFIYRVPRVGPQAKTWPLLAYRRPFAMAAAAPAGKGRAAKALSDHLTTFFGALLEVAPDSPANQARPVRVAVSYAFPLNEEERTQIRAKGTEAVILTRVPLVLRPVSDFVPARDLLEAEGLCQSLGTFLLKWADDNQVWDQGGRFCFDVTVYSNLASSGPGGEPRPLIELPDVRLPLDAVLRS